MSSVRMTALRAPLCRGCLFVNSQRAADLPRCSHGAVQRHRVLAREVATSSVAEEPQVPGGARAPGAPTFQEAVSRLQNFWSSRGCIVWLPHNTEVGAGTMNPATFLRVLGPEPWNVSYTEPSVRPDDSRYGLNPNRVQRHTQYQVILKPDPGNPQELYLESLEALGIDTTVHDVRFVEDNWESPSLGAWGLGWEVWLNGMEVTQFTYFQQSGSQTLDVPAVEITYGLERILMALQGVKHFKDIRYNDTVSYGQLFLQNEHEMSVFNLEKANTSVLQQHFSLFEQEAIRLLEERLPIPAYDHILKLSHFFNLLDSRGAVGFSERQDNFARMRNLARQVSKVFQESRAELEFPLGEVPPLPVPESSNGVDPASVKMVEGAADFVMEIGTEELPPAEVSSAISQLQERLESLLADLAISHNGVNVQGTPRRLVAQVSQLAAVQNVTSEERRGPPRKRAYDDDGAPTKALLGFCKSNGVDVDTVYFKADAKGTEYCYVTINVGGETASAVLQDSLPDIIKKLSFGKSMRWMPHSEITFSRPVRWLLALHGDTQIPFTLGSLQSSTQTRLLRQSVPPTVEVSSASEYREALADAGIVLGQPQRAAQIWKAVQETAQTVGGVVPESADLLAEVSNLVEAPTVLHGEFSTDFLRLPVDLLVMTMRKHQRYFPVYAADTGELMNTFITVANGNVDIDVVRRGNEDVLRARFEDATFFYEEDMKKDLHTFLPALEGTVFHKDLGSVFSKSQREVELVRLLPPLLQLPAAADVALEAAQLAKADLATAVVSEMTSLAGVMGRHYAQKQGKSKEVADAIFEGVLPRSANDVLPSTDAGIIVSVADKLDSLVALGAKGCLPSSGADRYGLRRITYGLLQTLISNKVDASLKELVKTAVEVQNFDISEEMQQEIVEFTTRRLEQYILDQEVPPEVARAVLKERSDNSALAVQSAKELKKEVQAEQDSLLPQVLTVLSRPTRLVRGKQDEAQGEVDSSLFSNDDEKKLWTTLQTVREKISPGMGVGPWLNAVVVLAQPVDTFFTNVLVMDKDENVRRNRLALCREVAEVSNGVVDLSELPGF